MFRFALVYVEYKLYKKLELTSGEIKKCYCCYQMLKEQRSIVEPRGAEACFYEPYFMHKRLPTLLASREAKLQSGQRRELIDGPSRNHTLVEGNTPNA